MPHTLLLADDSVTVQRVIELTFADEDVNVVAVGNGQDAIDRVQRERPDIVLADVGMPQRDGYDVAAFVKGDPATAHIPVVLLTGAFEPVDEGRARSIGCAGVLVKPFEPQQVISRVKELLAGRVPDGMWNSPPAAQAALRAATGFEAAPAASAPGGDPLEAYFDQLDAAFSPPTAAAVPTATAPPVKADPPAPQPTASAAADTPSAPAAAPMPVSLVDAFAALLSAEQQTAFSPPAVAAPAISDEMIEDISARVLSRLTEQSRPVILDVAEKLVREEIERIKNASGNV
jgi:CheY-like chemotaxis protein